MPTCPCWGTVGKPGLAGHPQPPGVSRAALPPALSSLLKVSYPRCPGLTTATYISSVLDPSTCASSLGDCPLDAPGKEGFCILHCNVSISKYATWNTARAQEYSKGQMCRLGKREILLPVLEQKTNPNFILSGYLGFGN